MKINTQNHFFLNKPDISFKHAGIFLRKHQIKNKLSQKTTKIFTMRKFHQFQNIKKVIDIDYL